MSSPTVVCTCGLPQPADSMPFVGFQSLANGDVGELRNCTRCRSTCCVRIIEGASVCESCKRVVRGHNGDTKVIACRHDGTIAVYCSDRACAATLSGDEHTDGYRALLRGVVALGYVPAWPTSSLSAICSTAPEHCAARSRARSP